MTKRSYATLLAAPLLTAGIALVAPGVARASLAEGSPELYTNDT